jgi:hypothetical protein
VFHYDLAEKSSLYAFAEDLLKMIEEEAAARKAAGQRFQVNVICYSAGSVIVRIMLRQFYQSTTARDWKINRVIMIAPIPFGSSVANLAPAKRKLLDNQQFGMFDTSDAIVARLKPTSVFLHQIANEDMFVSYEDQYYRPDRTMLFVIQGLTQYDLSFRKDIKDIKGSALRGSDGIAPYSASGMYPIRSDFSQ